MNEIDLMKKLEKLEKEIADLKNKQPFFNFQKIKKLFRKRILIPLSISSALIATIAYAAAVPNTFTAGDTISASQFNANFDYIEDRLWELNGLNLYFTGGDVGIGTATPSYNLDVAGDINFSGTLYQNGSAFSSGSSIWTENGTDIYFNTGDVGIGTTNPGAPFDVESSSTSNINDRIARFRNTVDHAHLIIDAGLNRQPSLELFEDGSRKWALQNSSSDDRLMFQSGTLGTEVLTILTGGSVGIGKTSPAYLLDVSGDINFTGTLYQNGSAFSGGGSSYSLDADDGSPTNALYVDAAGEIGIGTTTPSGLLHLDSNSGNVDLLLDSETGFSTIGFRQGGTANMFSMGLVDDGSFRIARAQAINYAPLIFFINDSNQIGIGTGTPNARLAVVGDTDRLNDVTLKVSVSTSQTGDIQQWRTFGGQLAEIDASGNFGLGVIDPTGILQVDGGTSTTGSGTNITLEAQDGYYDPGVSYNGGNIILTPGSGSEGGSDGNVGIGTASPGTYTKVHVVQNSTPGSGATLYGLYVDSSNAGDATDTNIAGYFSAGGGSADNYGLIVENGNVGIGTTSPTGILHIDGGTSTTGSGTSITLKAQDGYQTSDDGGDIILTPGSGAATGVDGNVGIGTTTPTATLHVNNSAPLIGEFSLKVTNSENNDGLYVTEQGKVGISDSGAITPASTFELSGSFATSAIVTKTSAYTLTADNYIVFANSTSAILALTLPTAVGIEGRRYLIKKIAGNYDVNIWTTSSQTIDSKDSAIATRIYGSSMGWIEVISDGSNWIIIGGKDYNHGV